MSSKQKTLPDKMYFRIGEAAEILDVKPYVLRYWETEFPDIKPVKSKSNQRLYKRRDVEMLMAIKRLLYDEKFTINGARQHLKDMMRGHGRTEEGQVQLELAAPSASKSAKGTAPSANVKKVLAKLKGDLEWCAAELRK